MISSDDYYARFSKVSKGDQYKRFQYKFNSMAKYMIQNCIH